jgi:hypothetical protein
MAATGCSDVLQYLLDQDLDPTLTDENGNTPLMSAALAGQSKNVELLLHYKQVQDTLHLENRDGETAFTLSLIKPRNPSIECAAMIAEAGGADIHHVNRLGLSVFWSCLTQSRTSSLAYLMELGYESDLREEDNAGRRIADFLTFSSLGGRELLKDLQGAPRLNEFLDIKKRAQTYLALLQKIQPDKLSDHQRVQAQELSFIKELVQTTAKKILQEAQEWKLLQIVEVTRECICCGDQKTQSEECALGPADCACYVCQDCLPTYLKSVLQRHEGQLVVCSQCRGLVRSAFLRRNHVSETEVQKFLKRQITIGNARIPCWVPCPTEDCLGGRIVLPGQEAYYVCACCDQSGCLQCGLDHRGADCKEKGEEAIANQKRLERLLELGKLPPLPNIISPEDERYYHGRYRACYHCGLLTERNEGCNGITCKRCGKKWNWNTGSSEKHDTINARADYEPEFPAHF